MSSDDQYLFWQTMGATAALLAITIVPILFSRQRVLLERWLVWATLSAAILVAWLLGQPGLITLATLAAVTLITELMRLYKFANWSIAVAVVVAIVAGQLSRDPERLALLGMPTLFAAGLILGFLAAPQGVRSKGAVVLGLAFAWLIWTSLFLQTAQAMATLWVVACFDVAAWAGGRFLARGPLAWHFSPKASPNKTLAGLIVGAFGALVAMVAIDEFNPYAFVVIVVLATLGDYIESRVKRGLGVKDASNWLPGFGGLLDRFDSLLLLLPLTSVYSLLPLFRV